MKNILEYIRKSYTQKQYFGIAILAFAMSIYLLLEIKNNRFNAPDLEVYYTAAVNLIDGENLYREPGDGHYVFKYSPVCALYFVPFAILPFTIAKILYWFFLTTIICYGLVLSYKVVDPKFGKVGDQKRYNNLILLTAFAISAHSFRELELGQVNHLLFFMYVLTLALMQKNYKILPSFVLALTVFIKPFGLIFLPWLFLRKQYKMVGFFFLFLMILSVLPAIFIGFEQLYTQYFRWYQELQIELSLKQSLLADANHTIFSQITRYTPLRWTAIPESYSFIYQLLVLILLSFLILWIFIKGKNLANSEVLEGAILINLIPLLAFTSYNAFGFAQLAVCIILYYYPKMSSRLKLISVIAIVFVGGNIYELWGSNLWTLFNELSIVGIGATILAIVLTRMRYLKTA